MYIVAIFGPKSCRIYTEVYPLPPLMNWAEEGFGDEGKAQASLEGHGGEDQREAGTGGQAEVGPQQQLVNQYCPHGVHPLFSSAKAQQVRVEGGSGSSGGEALLGREGGLENIYCRPKENPLLWNDKWAEEF